MSKRENDSIFEFNGRKFRLKSFDPLLGNYILSVILTKSIPIFGNSEGEKISKEEYIDLQKDVLKHVSEILPAGDADVILKSGDYGINDLTITLASTLFTKELEFNFNDFFEESQSKD